MLSNQDIAQMFARIADALEVQGANRFRINAYRKASDTLAALTVGLATLREQDDLTNLPNIGATSAQIINELLDQGYSPIYDALMTQVPPGLLDLLRVPAIGPKTAARLYHDHGISDLQALYAAAKSGTLREIKGFGAKTEARIVQSIDEWVQRTPRLRLVDAMRVMHELVASLTQLQPVSHVAPAGSVRRGCATVGDLNLVVAASSPSDALAAISTLPQVAAASVDAGIMELRLHNGMQVRLIVVPPQQLGATLVRWTGAQAHLEQLDALLAQRGWLLDTAGLHTPAGLQPMADEAAVYAALDLDWVPPELREGWGEITAAQQHQLPRLITPQDLRADLHWHTQWSDGRATLREMAEAGRALGYTYMAVADHSAYLGVTGGLDAKRLKQQRAEIDSLNAEWAAQDVPFRLLQCCEVDILPDGSLALADAILAQLDLVIASPHVALRQERAAATERLVRAISNPHVDIIGHPTGRLLEERAGADLDMEQVIAAAAANQTILEVNAGPERLDLDGHHVRQALQAGVKISIDTDAHDPRHLAEIGLGVTTARRGWATPADVVNTWPLSELQAWLNAKS